MSVSIRKCKFCKEPGLSVEKMVGASVALAVAVEEALNK